MDYNLLSLCLCLLVKLEQFTHLCNSLIPDFLTHWCVCIFHMFNRLHLHHEAEKGYGHSMIFLAYFLTTLSSPKMNRDLLTVKQFSLTGMGLYKAMVRARCALVCLKAGEMPPVDTAAPSRFRLRSDPPSPELNKPGTSSPKRAILSKTKKTKITRKGSQVWDRRQKRRL